MDPELRAAQKDAFRRKNERRKGAKKYQGTSHGQHGRELRQKMGGAFGKEDPAVFNECVEGLGRSIQRRAETDNAR